MLPVRRERSGSDRVCCLFLCAGEACLWLAVLNRNSRCERDLYISAGRTLYYRLCLVFVLLFMHSILILEAAASSPFNSLTTAAPESVVAAAPALESAPSCCAQAAPPSSHRRSRTRPRRRARRRVRLGPLLRAVLLRRLCHACRVERPAQIVMDRLSWMLDITRVCAILARPDQGAVLHERRGVQNHERLGVVPA